MQWSDCNWTRTQNHLVLKRTLNHLAKRVHDITRTYSQMHLTEKYSEHSSIFVKNGKCKHHHWILHIQICQSKKFQLKLAILMFCTKFAQKRYFWSKTESERHYWILNIPINLSTKFLLNVTILNLLAKANLPQKGWFLSKAEKVNTAIEFWIFDLA